MTPTLRDALAAARINRMKARAELAWQRQREAAAEPSEPPVCPGCGVRHPRGLFDLLRGGVLPDDEAPTPADKSHH